MSFKLNDKQKLWLRGAAEIVVTPFAEDTPIKGNVLASGDPAEDARAEYEVQQQIMRGNEYAWCTIRVSLRWKSFIGTAYLGCCSYASHKEFIEGDYFPDMVAEAFDDLVSTIESEMDSVSELLAVSNA